MRTLADAFASGSPALPEGLRTLHVSPGRVVEPGMTVHANFTFRNLGGGTATGFRVRFRLPEGLTYLVGTARIDDAPLDEEGGLTSLLQGAGTPLGDVPPGAERRISLAYSVATTIENGTPISLQAALASFEVPVIGSNVVRLVVRSKPVLKSNATRLAVTAVRELVPGAELQVKAQIHNSGQSSAHDVVALIPVPPNTAYVPGSARIDNRPLEETSESEPFGLTRPTIVAKTLGPGASVDVAYRVAIDQTLADATPITATAAVCTQELAEFALTPVTLKVPSAPSFAGDETSLRVECDDDVVPGQRVKCVVRLRNIGTALARGVRVRLSLPEGLSFTPGSRSVDGAPAIDREREPGVFELGDVEPGRAVEVGLAAVVRSPIADGTELPIGAKVHWSKGERGFERTLAARSHPWFPAAFNAIARETARRAAPGEAVAYTVRVQNMGSDAAADARLMFEADEELEQIRVSEKDSELTLDDGGVVHLDTLEPHAPRTLRIEARVAAAIEDQAQLRLRATLHASGLPPVDLGTALHVVASRPKFSTKTSSFAPEKDEVLRPSRTTGCRLVLHNEGTERARDVRVRFQFPDELRLENVEGAARDGEHVVFGEIPAQESREAMVHLRLLGNVAFGDSLEIAARASGANVVPVSLDPVTLSTHAEPSFGDGATLTSIPADAIDAGDEVIYTLAVRNSGDGNAKRLALRMDAPSNAVYAPGSTSVNDVPLLDFAGTSPLLGMGGLTLGDVGAGVEVIARLIMIVNTPLPADAYIETRAYVTWDEQPEIIIRAEPLRVRSAPALPIVDPLLPFSVIDAAAAPAYRNGGAQRALNRAEEYIELPAATPVRGALPSGNGDLDEPAPRNVTRRTTPVTLSSSKGPASRHAPNDVTLTESRSARVPSKGDASPHAPTPVTLSSDNRVTLTELRSARASSKGGAASHAGILIDDSVADVTLTYLDLPEDRLAWTVHYLEEARVDGLIGHLMVLRALFPTAASSGAADSALRNHAAILHELIDRLFVKIRMPGIELQPDDLETASSRASLSLVLEAFRTESHEADGAQSADVRLVGYVERAEIDAAAESLKRAKLVTAAPWRAAALLLGRSLQRNGTEVADLSAYREGLLRAFDRMADLTPAKFEAALREPADLELELERDTVLRALSDERSVTA